MVRGRKPKAPKAQNPETSPLGSNVRELSEDEKRALFLQNIVQLEALNVKAKSVNADIRNLRKRIKSEGFAPEQVNYALFLRKTDQGAALELHRQALQVARWLAHPIGTQPDMFSDDDNPNRPKDGPYEQGKTSGLAGETRGTGKWQPNSPEGRKFMEGWDDGQSILMGNFKKKPDDEADKIFDLEPRRVRGMPSAKPVEDGEPSLDPF